MTNQKHTVTIIEAIGPSRVAEALLNSSCAPPQSQRALEAATKRFGVFLSHVQQLPHEIEASRTSLHSFIRRNGTAFAQLAATGPDRQYVMYDDGLPYIPRLQSILVEFKAFLDIFSKFIYQHLGNKSAPNGFNSKKIDGVDVSGGACINWIKGQCLQNSPERDELANILLTASCGWITRVVGLRDTIVHIRDLQELVPTHANVTLKAADIVMEEIHGPAMRDGLELFAFAIQTRDELGQLVATVLRHLPNIDQQKLSSWPDALKHMRGG